MDKISFSKLVADLFLYFDRQKLPESEQINIWFDDLKFIPVEAIDQIKKHFKDMDSLPRNIPKAIKSGFSSYKKTNPISVTYDFDDDPRFPIEFLEKAFEILSESGDASFSSYCEKVKMPKQDIERVRNKYNYIQSNSI